jgi:small subunit ribosomal protein S4
MRYTGPKDRLSRREGVDLFGKGPKLRRLNVPPGMHGPKGAKIPQGYARQLREKQKAKRIYGLSEKQFKKYVEAATKAKGVSFLDIIERRLDNVVYRLGFAKTRMQARQLVSHRHVLVNGKYVNIPSYQVREGETISLDEKAMKIPDVVKLLQEEVSLPAWLAREAAVGKVLRLPSRQDINEPISEQEIVEFYSR